MKNLMGLICLDLEGVLVPEIWIEMAKETGLDELKLTTRDISDYNELMKHRLNILNREKIMLNDIQKVIATIQPLSGAAKFVSELRLKSQLVILSDTFGQFAAPLMEKLKWPTLFCNTLEISGEKITGYRLRQPDGKRKAVEAFQSMGLKVFAAGDSYNDITMLKTAHKGMLFHAPDSIKEEFPHLATAENYKDLMTSITEFLEDS